MQVASEKYLELKKEVSRMASLANKRLRRLERNDLTNLPAYRAWEKNGSIAFSVKGKDYNQLQSEYWRLKNFIDDRTSMVKSANAYLREIAENTGIKYKGLADLKAKATKFFQLVDKIQQYNRLIGESAKALNYRQIWNEINTMLQETKTDLASIASSEDGLERYLSYMNSVVEVENNSEGFSDNGTNWDFIDL